MGQPENFAETLFNDEVHQLGGFTRKWVSPGHKFVPDRICFLPHHPRPLIWFVEEKSRNETPNNGQLREMQRLKTAGCNVIWLSGCNEVLKFINQRRLELNA